MAFTGNTLCTSTKVGFLTGAYTPLIDTMKVALYTNIATLDATTTAYTTTGEVVGVGYTAGGNVLSGATINFSGTTAWLTFNDSTWLNSTITARGALIYDSTRGNAAIAVLDFGADKATNNTSFIIQFPIASATSSVIRIA